MEGARTDTLSSRAEAKARISWADMLKHDQLDLSGLGLCDLPREIARLSRLTALNLAGNQFDALPDALAGLTGVRELDLADNLLSKLPDWLQGMQGLKRLDLSSNRLKALPRWLADLHGLEELYLHDNADLSLPPDLLGPTRSQVSTGQAPTKPATILAYYLKSFRSRPLNEAKLILVGQGNVGKTSLVNRLVKSAFDPQERKTEGINLTDWELRLRDEDVTLHIWDFGGQEVMHATHQFFLTQRSLYLLVLNGRQGGEDRDAEYWLRLIASFGADSPVIVVLNKIREHPFDLNRRALEQKYPGVRAFIRTDCEDGTGIDDLRAAIERETDRLEHLRDVFPASWFAIKHRLVNMRENFLSFERYRDLCRSQGEADAAAQDRLAASLHSLGIALNYKDDVRLRDTSVLKPHWVTNGIYTLINAQKVADGRGVLALADVSAVLEARDYPPEKHGFLLELMRKFELCFAFPEDTEARYLIPEFLDKQEPDVTRDFVAVECLNFEYWYPVLPEGLLPRFIVRTHSLSAREPSWRWRTGVILEWERCRALVKADAADGKVTITVHGPDAEGRRRLLAVIRSDFDRIHAQFAKLGVVARVPVPECPNVSVDYDELLAFERSGEMHLKKFIEGEIVTLDVRALLNGVDLTASRRSEPAAAPSTRLFYSYSHRDESLRDELETHLKVLERLGLIGGWHDRKITAGKEWKGKIDDELRRADVILLLISADFIGSDYCMDLEVKLAMQRHEAGEARVVPIILRDVPRSWTRLPFGQLQSTPTDAKPVVEWESRDSAWRNVVEHIEMLVMDIRDRLERRGARIG